MTRHLSRFVLKTHRTTPKTAGMLSMPDIKSPVRSLNGRGVAAGGFGELAQGRRADGVDFLFSLPINLYSRCEISARPVAGPLSIDCTNEKSKAALALALQASGITRGVELIVEFQSDLPVGKGLSSSSADMLASLRAAQAVFDFEMTQAEISALFAQIEPHDPTHFDNVVAYNHRAGELLAAYDYVPSYHILAVDLGGTVDTQAYNRALQFSPSQTAAHTANFAQMDAALRRRDDAAIASAATQSARLHADIEGNSRFAVAIQATAGFGASGVVVTHSGSCMGLLYPAATPSIDFRKIEAAVRAKGFDTFRVSTLDAGNHQLALGSTQCTAAE